MEADGEARTFSAAAIERALAALGHPGVPISFAMATASTNDDARRARDAVHGSVFVADAQHQGRGRQGRGWHSPAGENLYLSMVWRPALEPDALAPLALVAGLAVADAVDHCLGASRARIKWPNDVEVDGRKIAGILVEATTQQGSAPFVVTGVGLNVLSTTFPPPLAARATSLALAAAKELDRATVAARVVVSLTEREAAFRHAGLASLIAELGARDSLRGRRVRIGALSGTATGVDAQGRLVVRDDRGVSHSLHSGEVETVATP
jgi:BirA family biotin operon repressor/biotin-[acetyl-CoA-carboxylase] ligase